MPRSVLGFVEGPGDQGAAFFRAENPPFGAVFTYYLRDGYKPKKAQRAEREKAAVAKGESTKFPGWDAVDAEAREAEPKIWFTVKDSEGRVVRRLSGKTGKGFHRIAWDLRYPTPNAVTLVEAPKPDWGNPPRGLLAAPGRYTVTMAREVDGVITQLAEPQPFDVVPLRAPRGADVAEVAAFWRSYETAVRDSSAVQLAAARLQKRISRMGKALQHARTKVGADLDKRYQALRAELLDIDRRLNGSPSRRQIGEKRPALLGDRLSSVQRGIVGSTAGPTATHRTSLALANEAIRELGAALRAAEAKFSALAKDLVAAGAPFLEGASLPDTGR